MASGPTGTGWSDLIRDLNNIFGDNTKRRAFAIKFKDTHGRRGNGDPVLKKPPYKFGHFVDKHGSLLPDDNERSQFLMDAGTRHWDASLDLLEHAIKQSLAHENPDGTPAPKKIEFRPVPAASGAMKARAVIKDQKGTELRTKPEIEAASSLQIDIVCPPANPRPRP
jgi:hypothetical protein